MQEVKQDIEPQNRILEKDGKTEDPTQYDPEVPDTADHTNIPLWGSMMFTSVLMALWAAFKRRQYQ